MCGWSRTEIRKTVAVYYHLYFRASWRTVLFKFLIMYLGKCFVVNLSFAQASASLIIVCGTVWEVALLFELLFLEHINT